MKNYYINYICGPGRWERKKEGEKLLNEIITENFPEILKVVSAIKTISSTKINKYKELKTFAVKLQKSYNKEENLKYNNKNTDISKKNKQTNNSIKRVLPKRIKRPVEYYLQCASV